MSPTHSLTLLLVFPFLAAIKETVEWFMANYEVARK
jgi:hypothetical protein